MPELQSDGYFRILFEGMSAAVIVADCRGRYVEVNPAATALLGYTRDELLQMTIGQIEIGDPEPPSERRRQLALDPRGVEREMRRKDGVPIAVAVQATKLDLPFGGVAYVAVLHDISERKRAESALRDSEVKHRVLLDSIRSPVLALNEDMSILYCNDAYALLVGMPSGELEGQKLLELSPALARTRSYKGYLDVLRTGETHEAEEWIGERFLHAWVYRTPWGILAIAEDVTERRQVEAALRESEARLHSIVETSPDPIAVLDEEGRYRFVNSAYQRVLGYAPEALIGQPAFALLHDDDATTVIERFRGLVRPSIDRPTSHAGRLDFVCRVRHADGAWLAMEPKWQVLADASGGFAGVVVISRDVTERTRLEEMLTHQEFHDPLTGLPNRALLMDRLEHALARVERRRSIVAVLLLDLDRFKLVNDSLGHAAGDQLLIEVGERLAGCIQPGDTIARLGGDEFTVLIEDAAGADDVTALGERLLDVLHKPFVLDGREVFVTTSIGIVITDVAQRQPVDLLREADIALYEAKGAGKGRAVRFAPQMDSVTRRLDMESGLRRAIERGELRLCYQPIVDLSTGTVTAVEALARWQHPDQGAIEPAEFIPLAEETGFIVELWEWLIAESCRRAREWQSIRPEGPPLLMSVNISPAHLQQPDLVQQIAAVLATTTLDPTLLRVEITENALMRDVEGAVRVVRTLKDLGVRVAIDDFGTGYSSLSYLGRFPVDTIKVDQTFVSELEHDPATVAIVQAIATLGHTLGMQIEAEGVETAVQLAALRSLAADHAQGYLFARPLAPDELPSLLAAGAFAPLLGGAGARPSGHG